MFRIRFKQPTEDPRPVSFPPKHPYWVTGAGEGYHTLVAYVDSRAQLFKFWPEAYDLEWRSVTGYEFTDRFPKPDWFEEPAS